MAQAVHARLNAQTGVGRRPRTDDAGASSTRVLAGEDCLTVYEDLADIEQEWRSFEQHADCTVFQTFDWLATWQRHVGVRNGVRPAIVVGRDGGGHVLFMLPLATRAIGFARELTWLGTDLCDYNVPLLAADFSRQIDPAQFMSLWRNIRLRLRGHPRLHYDLIHLEKMPAMVGSQSNPMLRLGVTLNPSGAYLTHLGENWDAYYAAKRSSSTRQRDRSKRKRLSEIGEVRLVNPGSAGEILRTLDTLMAQKIRTFARMGVANFFARPGYMEFYRALASEPATKSIVHVSRLDVGSNVAAANLGLTFRDRYYHLLLSYDDGALSRFGPGAAHLHELLRRAIERGFRIFDFTIGDERYKRDWCDTELTLHDFIAVATWRGALIAAPKLLALRLKRWVKQTPAVWNAFQKGRALVGPLARRLRH